MPIIDSISPYLPQLTNRSVSNEDFRKTYHPIPVINSPAVLLSAIGFASPMLSNHFNRIPLLTGMHYGIFLGAFGMWAGYYLNRTSLKSKMGRAKYAMDFMERHKQNIPLNKSVHYGDPEYLYPWMPVR